MEDIDAAKERQEAAIRALQIAEDPSQPDPERDALTRMHARWSCDTESDDRGIFVEAGHLTVPRIVELANEGSDGNQVHSPESVVARINRAIERLAAASSFAPLQMFGILALERRKYKIDPNGMQMMPEAEVLDDTQSSPGPDLELPDAVDPEVQAKEDYYKTQEVIVPIGRTSTSYLALQPLRFIGNEGFMDKFVFQMVDIVWIPDGYYFYGLATRESNPCQSKAPDAKWTLKAA